MKLINVNELKGKETLAVPILSSSDRMLIQSGTILKNEYIEKLISLGIENVYVYDEKEKVEKSESKNIYTTNETFQQSMDEIETVLKKNIYKKNKDLEKVIEITDRILNDLLSEKRVIEKITEIRNISTDIYSHCINVSILATVMALRLKMNDEQVRNVAKGAILHDMGLKYTNAECINENVEDLSKVDAEEYKKHPLYGYSCVQEEEWLSDSVKEIILLHHEKIDGSGYPLKKTGDKIKTEVRLVSICDDFDSIISGIGKKKLKLYQAIEYIKMYSGIYYDSDITAKFLETVAAYPVKTEVLTNTGDRAIVVRQNIEMLERPVIRIVKSADESNYKVGEEIDLLKYLTVFIVDTY